MLLQRSPTSCTFTCSSSSKLPMSANTMQTSCRLSGAAELIVLAVRVLMLAMLLSRQLVLFKAADPTVSAINAWHATAQCGMEGGLPMSSAGSSRSQITSSSVGRWLAWDRSLHRHTSSAGKAGAVYVLRAAL